jgi:hypothetical protein
MAGIGLSVTGIPADLAEEAANALIAVMHKHFPVDGTSLSGTSWRVEVTHGDAILAGARISRAMYYAGEFGYIDGAHHKQWVIDQMVRALTGCPVTGTAAVIDGEYDPEVQGESDEYREWVTPAGEDDPGWDEGIAP